MGILLSKPQVMKVELHEKMLQTLNAEADKLLNETGATRTTNASTVVSNEVEKRKKEVTYAE